jgi:hypothetical protein
MRRAEEEQEVGPERAAGVQRLGVDDDALGAQLAEQRVVGGRQRRAQRRELRVGLVLLAVELLRRDLLLERALDLVALGGEVGDVALVDLRQELRVGHVGAVRLAGHQRREQEVQGQERDDEIQEPPAARHARHAHRPALGVLALGRAFDAPRRRLAVVPAAGGFGFRRHVVGLEV